MDPIFRLNGAIRHSDAVDAWFDERDADLSAIARRWFELMRGCGDDVCELIHDGCPVACVGDAAFAYVDVFKAHVNVGFFYGAHLDDPSRLLQGSGRRMRHVKVRPGFAVDETALTALIDLAYADLRMRLIR